MGEAISVILCVCGIVASFLCSDILGQPVSFSVADIWILVSEFAYTMSLVITRKYLSNLPLGVLVVYRLGVGTVLYHLYIGCSDGFSFSRGFFNLGMLWHGKLWYCMWWYGLIYATLLQVLWLRALVHAHPTIIGAGTAAQFGLTLLWSMLLQGEFPSYPQMLGAVILTISMALGIVKEVLRCDKQPLDAITTNVGMSVADAGSFATWDGVGCLPSYDGCRGNCEEQLHTSTSCSTAKQDQV